MSINDINNTNIYNKYDYKKTYLNNVGVTSPSLFSQPQKDIFILNQSSTSQVQNIDTSSLKEDLEKTKSEQGIIGKIWDGFKNLTGIGASSSKAQKAIEDYEKGIISQEEMQKAVDGYKEGQKTVVDVVGDIASGILAVGAFALAVPTGGASLAIGLSAACAVGAGVKIGIKAGDTAIGGREYTGKDLLYDTATGAINGLLAPITNGIGNTVTKTIATKFGLSAVKEGAEEIGKQTIKQTLKSVILNQSDDIIGGTLKQRAVAFGAGMAADGALGGAADNMVRAGLEGENILKAGAEGFIGGLIMAPIVGGGMKIAGKAGNVLNNKITMSKVLPDGLSTKFKQGSVGDCALLSTIDGMMNNPNTADKIKKSITKTIGGDYNVKIGDNIVQVPKSSLSDEILSDTTGIKPFEAAYKKLNGSIDGGFAEVVAQQFGLNPIHITNDGITDELLDKLAKSQGETVLSFGTLVDTNGAITNTNGTKHYFTIKNIDANTKKVTLTSPIDTSKTIELDYEQIKNMGISIDGGSVVETDLPNVARSADEIGFRGIDVQATKNDILTNINKRLQDANLQLSESDISEILNKTNSQISFDSVAAMLKNQGISAEDFAEVLQMNFDESGSINDAFISTLNTLQHATTIQNCQLFEPFNLTFADLQNIHNALLQYDHESIKLTLMLRDEAMYEKLDTLIGDAGFDERLQKFASRTYDALARNNYAFCNPEDVAEITVNQQKKNILFPNATGIKPVKKLPDNAAEVLIKSNFITTDIIKKLPNLDIELPENCAVQVPFANGANGASKKIYFSTSELIEKVNTEGIESLSSYEIHALTDCFKDLYGNTKNANFRKMVDDMLSNNQSMKMVYGYIEKMQEMANPILKKYNMDIEEHAYLRMIDRNIATVIDRKTSKTLSFKEFIEKLAIETKGKQAGEYSIPNIHNENSIKVKLIEKDGKIVIDTIMLE